MAPPPPSAALPLTQRLLALAQTLQFAWFVGHMTLLFCILRYSLSYITFNYYSGWARFSYRTAFISAAVTYGIVVYKAFRARARAVARGGAPVSLSSIMTDENIRENIQYLAMALVWLFSPQYPLAMLPFGVYSVFHVATYTRTNLIPTLQPPPAAAASPNGKPKSNATADTIGKFVKEYYDASMGLVALLEILLWGRILLSAIVFARYSWILLTIYTAFLRARFAQSAFVRGQFSRLEARTDSLVGAQSTPPAARQVWESIKSAARTFHDATDLTRYISGPAPPKKAS